MCSEPEIPRLLFRMPRFRDWADIFRDASFSINHSIPLCSEKEKLPIGNNRDCVIQSWLSAWIERNFISHSLHSVVALLVIGDFVYL